jgi:hypothetical protein
MVAGRLLGILALLYFYTSVSTGWKEEKEKGEA